MYPDRPPPHPTSPFRWIWDDEEALEYLGRARQFCEHPSPRFFDTSDVHVPADRSVSQLAAALRRLLNRAQDPF